MGRLGVVAAALQQEAVERAREGGRGEDRQGERRGEPEVVVEDGDEVAAEQEQGAVGEVEHARGLEDHDEAERDERVDRPERQSAEDVVEQTGHAASSSAAPVPR